MRVRIFKLLCILSFMISVQMIAQSTFKFGPELGMSITQFRETKSYIIKERNDAVTEVRESIYSPLLGITSECTFKKYIYVSVGLQYQKSGFRYRYHRDGNLVYSGETYTTDQWMEQKFSKLCLPVAIGLTIKLGKFQPAIFAGWRPNYFVKGSHYEKQISDYVNPEDDYSNESSFDPFNSQETGAYARRYHGQRFFGISSSIGPGFKLTVTYNKGGSLLYARDAQSDIANGYRNNDYVASLAWQFSTARKRKAYIISFPTW